MKKIAIVALTGALVVGSAHAAGPTGKEASVQGELTLTAACPISLALGEPHASMAVDEAVNNKSVSSVEISSGCDGKLWLGPGQRDGSGNGVMHNGNETANYALRHDSSATDTKVNGGYIVVSRMPVTKGHKLEASVNLGTGDFGLPKTPGVWTYTVNGGHWAD